MKEEPILGEIYIHRRTQEPYVYEFFGIDWEKTLKGGYSMHHLNNREKKIIIWKKDEDFFEHFEYKHSFRYSLDSHNELYY